MNTNQLADAIGEVRDEYVADADRHPSRKKWIALRWAGMAACVCLIAVGTAFALSSGQAKPDESGNAFHYFATASEKTPEPAPDTAVEAPMPIPHPEPVPSLLPAEKQPVDYGVFLPAQSNLPYAALSPTPPIPMIEWYRGERIAADLAVYNGGVMLSEALQGALEEYGGSARYRVIATLFVDGMQVPCDSPIVNEEAERVAAEGLITAMEILQNESGTSYLFSMHLTAEQLRSFPASDQAGWLLELYDEQFDMPEPIPTPYVVYNGAD